MSGLVSLVVHLVLLTILALCVLSRLPGGEHWLTLIATSQLDAEQLRGSNQADSSSALLPVSVESAVGASAQPDLLPIPQPIEAASVTSLARSERQALVQPLEQAARDFPKPSASGENAGRPRLSEATNVKEAMGGVLGEIDGRLKEQDLLVVWLFDASLSLSGDRPQIAERMGRFFADHEDRSDQKKPVLLNAAVAFGSAVVELEHATRYGRRIVDAMYRVPNDTSGVENVCGAVKWAVERYHRRKGHLMLVIWTDESGDDVHTLEATIQTCIRYKASVSVVGPTSVLGRVYGRQTFVQSGLRLSLPVNRGPDTAAPERLQLPYWFDTVFPVWGDLGDTPFNQLPAWYGGPQLEHLLCGTGPYPLVRITVATGGTYTLLDRPIDRSPFRLEIMRPYLPSYPSAAKYQEELRYHPLREAVAKAVEVTLHQTDWRAPSPDLVAPQAAALKDALVEQQEVARQSLAVIDKAQAAFGREGMEEQYSKETSRRWQAWYDLTRGRLLAGAVRFKEHEILCGQLAQIGKLGLDTNAVTFSPATTLRGGQPAQESAAEAKRLLKRCLLANARTPWAYLAARELDHAFGIDAQQQAVTVGPPTDPRSKPRPRPQVTPPRL